MFTRNYHFLDILISIPYFYISSVEKWRETFKRETIQGILFEIFLMESCIEIYGILIRISNTPPSLWVCRILTNNLELCSYSRENLCKWILYESLRGRNGNRGIKHIKKKSDYKKIKKVLICQESTFNVVVIIGIWNHLFEIHRGCSHGNYGTARSI